MATLKKQLAESKQEAKRYKKLYEALSKAEERHNTT